MISIAFVLPTPFFSAKESWIQNYIYFNRVKNDCCCSNALRKMLIYATLSSSPLFNPVALTSVVYAAEFHTPLTTYLWCALLDKVHTNKKRIIFRENGLAWQKFTYWLFSKKNHKNTRPRPQCINASSAAAAQPPIRWLPKRLIMTNNNLINFSSVIDERNVLKPCNL